MRKKYRLAVLITLFLWAYGGAEIGAGFNVGTGTRALSFAGSHTAAANDLSAVYWNPAALALLPVREFQMSFDGARVYGLSDVTGRSVTVPSGAKMDGYIERIRLSGVGAMTAIPTVQGGLTLAFSFDRPFIFDDVTVYKYEDTRRTYSSEGRRYGDLNMWSGAFGVQASDQISAGLTISLITGNEKAPISQKKSDSKTGTVIDDYADEYQNRYLGFRLIGGLLYYPMDILKVGMRINTAMDIGVKETRVGKEIEWVSFYDKDYEEWNSFYDTISWNTKDNGVNGRAYTAPSGALGVGLTLPWLTAALDLRATMPYTFILPSENIPDDVQAKYFKLGAGVGFEVPLTAAPVVLRGGYSLDEYDLYPIIHKFDNDESIDWDRFGVVFRPDGFIHTLSAGAAVFTSGIGFELSYGYRTWGMVNTNDSRKVKQRYSNHRIMTAIIFRY